MQRVLRIVLIITFMLLLILWFSTIFNTCNKDKAGTPAGTETVDQSLDTTDIFEDLGDDFFEDGSGTNNGANPSDADDVTNYDPKDNGGTTDPFADSESYTDYTGEIKQAPVQPAPSTKNAGDDASYLVVAGSFLVESNAVSLKNKLVNMGYAAEVRNFNFSQYYSVIAGRFNSKSSADQLASKLKAKGIDCLVQKRKY